MDLYRSYENMRVLDMGCMGYVLLIYATFHFGAVSGGHPQDRTEFHRYEGNSVLLPCKSESSSPGQTARWLFRSPTRDWVDIFNGNEIYKGRVEYNVKPPQSDFSVRLSNLTVQDSGTYSCDFGSQFRRISLNVKEKPPTTSPSSRLVTHPSVISPRGQAPPIAYVVAPFVVLLLLALGGVAVFVHIHRVLQGRVNTAPLSHLPLPNQGGLAKEQKLLSGPTMNKEGRTKRLECNVGPGTEEVKEDDGSLVYADIVHKGTTKDEERCIPNENSTEYATITQNR